MQKNLISHLSAFGRKNRDLYLKAINLPFVSDLTKFEETFEEIRKSPDVSEKEKKYLMKRYDGKELWAKCHLKSRFGGGISTTSRIESFHAKLKQNLTSSSSLQKVLQVFKDLIKIQTTKFKEEFLRHGNFVSTEKVMLLSKIEENCSDYISKKISPKLFKALNYTIEKKRNCNAW